MKASSKIFAACAVLSASAGIFFATNSRAAEHKEVRFPKGINHGIWEGLLTKYVDDKGLVDYKTWKASEPDMVALDKYLTLFAVPFTKAAEGDEAAATAINAYNAFAVRTILTHYPVASIQAIDGAFKSRIHEVGGEKVALEDIEHGTLRPAYGWRAHAALVCCARSCPPLQRFAYRANQLTVQTDTAYKTWLARRDLNQFLPDKKKVKISGIFEWFQSDFEKAGGVGAVLTKYAPAEVHDFLSEEMYQTEYLPYQWGLNDQNGQGEDYGKGSLIWDKIRNVF